MTIYLPLQTFIGLTCKTRANSLLRGRRWTLYSHNNHANTAFEKHCFVSRAYTLRYLFPVIFFFDTFACLAVERFLPCVYTTFQCPISFDPEIFFVFTSQWQRVITEKEHERIPCPSLMPLSCTTNSPNFVMDQELKCHLQREKYLDTEENVRLGAGIVAATGDFTSGTSPVNPVSITGNADILSALSSPS